MSDDISFIDAESYSTGFNDKVSFRLIVLEHIKRLAVIGSKELRGGYWTKTIVQVGPGAQVIEKYVPDTREEYSNAVNFLYDVLYPHFDEKMIEDDKSFEEWEIEESLKLKEIYNDKDEFKTNYVLKVKRKQFRILNEFLFRRSYLEAVRLEE